MTIIILAFAQARSVFGFSETRVDYAPDETPRNIVLRLCPSAQLSSLRVAIDCEYVDWDSPVGEAKELAILPPVSGG